MGFYLLVKPKTSYLHQNEQTNSQNTSNIGDKADA